MSEKRPIHLVVGTAGHIDHGKTSIVRALTGVDTDRLPEEKQRGITIVLGFAALDLPDGTRVGLIDVPGHERFVKNMVAGAGGMDLVLLVVAADEGVMPQTREHLEICELLGVEHGIVALTKIDKAGPELTELAKEDVRSHLAGTRLASAPIIECSSVTNEGVDTLRDQLIKSLSELAPRNQDSVPLLAVDRVFTVKGFGSVVTGTLLSGSIGANDQLDVLPPVQGRAIDQVRVRSVQVFHEQVDRAFAGDRTAVALQNASLDQLRVGQILTAVGTARPTRLVDVRLDYLRSRQKPLKTGAKALLHIGTDIVECGITLLDVDRLEPGHSGFARLRLKSRIACLPHQRFIVRGFDTDLKAGRTLGGGHILDPEPVRRKRKSEATIAILTTLNESRIGDRKEALTALVKERSTRGVDKASLSRRLGLTPKALDTAIAQEAKAKSVVAIGERIVHTDSFIEVRERILALIEEFHEAFPFRAGMPRTELASRLGRSVPEDVTDYAAKQLAGMKKLAFDSNGFRNPSHQRFSGAGEDARGKVMELLEAAELAPPSADQLAKSANVPPKTIKEILGALVRTGEIVRVSPEIVFAKKPFDDAKSKLVAHIESHGEMTTKTAKDLIGVSRKYLIPLLEALDKAQVTVRVGEARRLGSKAKG